MAKNKPDEIRTYSKPDSLRAYEITRRYRGNKVIGRIELPRTPFSDARIFQDNLTLQSLEQAELILAAEGYTQKPTP